jgi:hypothetical protein
MSMDPYDSLLAKYNKNTSGGQQQAQMNQLEIAKLKANEVARPKLGNYQGAAKNGQLMDQFKLKDPGAVKSPWLDQQLQQQDMLQTNALNQGAQRAASGAAGAQANLARHGGLSTGAAERMGQAAQQNQQLNAQDVYGQGAAQRLGMQSADMQNERGYQTGLQQQNIQTSLGDLAAKQGFDLKKYEEQMKGYGAEKSAQATEKAGGGGGSVICTALMDVGLITPAAQRKASEFRSEVSNDTYQAYLLWGTPVANAIRFVPTLGYMFRPLVRYWIGDRDILAVAQYKFFNAFNKFFVRKNSFVGVR